jgi:uroporphyrinogen-III synthase
MRLIVTRPPEDAARLLARLEALGHETICSPVIRIVNRENVDVPDLPFQAVALSSANAARAIAVHTAGDRLKVVPAFAVGKQSAAAAREAGFTQVIESGGDVHALAGTIMSRCSPDQGLLLYLSGAETAGDLRGTLEAKGFRVERLVLYDAAPAESLDTVAKAAVAGGNADGVLLYSPRSARIWMSLVVAAGLDSEATRLRHYCLSQNVAAALGGAYPTVVAARPEEDALLSLLDPAR